MVTLSRPPKPRRRALEQHPKLLQARDGIVGLRNELARSTLNFSNQSGQISTVKLADVSVSMPILTLSFDKIKSDAVDVDQINSAEFF